MSRRGLVAGRTVGWALRSGNPEAVLHLDRAHAEHLAKPPEAIPPRHVAKPAPLADEHVVDEPGFGAYLGEDVRPGLGGDGPVDPIDPSFRGA